jgi:hemoglobin
VLAICVVMTILAGTAAAEDKPAAPLERTVLDHRIEKLLRDVINLGADLYNSGDQQGCYRLYEGSLLTLRPLLDHHPELQKAIDQALADAQSDRNMPQRAFTLRATIDQVRSTIAATPQPPPPDRGPQPRQGATLWERLGGEENVKRIVDDFVNAAVADPKVDFDRGGKHKLGPAETAHLKEQFVKLASFVSKGPLKYDGKSMKEAHKGMGITDAQFDALLLHMRTALEKHGVKPDDTATVMKAVEATRKDIVEN